VTQGIGLPRRLYCLETKLERKLSSRFYTSNGKCKLAKFTSSQPLRFKSEERYKKQVNDNHYLADWLMPINVNKERFYEGEQTRVLNALEALIEPRHFSHTQLTFLSYDNRIDSFKETNRR
jgi:hypothetical protein